MTTKNRIENMIAFIKSQSSDCLGYDASDGHPYRDEVHANLTAILEEHDTQTQLLVAVTSALHQLPTVAGVVTQEVYINYGEKGGPECLMHSGVRRCAMTMQPSFGTDTPTGIEWLQSLCTSVSLFLNARRIARDVTKAGNESH